MQNVKRGFVLEGIFSMGLAVLMFFLAGISNGLFLLSIPFELIGAGLRRLSLSNTVGNGIAVLVFAVISLIPIFYMIYKIKKYRWDKVDVILPIISFYSFYMIYSFINPGLLLNQLPALIADASAMPYIKLSLSILFYSLCISYVILHTVGKLSKENMVNNSHYLYSGLQKILLTISVLYTFLIGYFSTFQLLVDFYKNIKEERSTVSFLFVFIKYTLKNLPILFTILIFMSAILLLKAMITNETREEMEAANRLGSISRRAVYITVISNITLNGIQFLLSNRLNDTDFSLEFSLFPLIISFSAMIISGYLRKTKELVEDNELII